MAIDSLATTAATIENGKMQPIDPPLPDTFKEGQWTPQTVISTLPYPPESNTTSPLPFLHTIARLKTTKREGWRRFGLSQAESISDHMYRMSIITLLAPPSLIERGLDVGRATKLALIHDMAESLVGDITPVDNVPKAEKNRREETTMSYLCGPKDSLLAKFAGGQAGKDMQECWQEYEDSQTLESKFVHDVDKIELLLQMVEYERMSNGEIDLGEFSHVAKRVELPECQEWTRDILKEREEFWKGIGKTAKDAENGVSDERKAQLQNYYDRGEK